MEDIIQKLAKESKRPEQQVSMIAGDICISLVKEGCETTNPKFLIYLVRRLRKRLKIEESNTYKTFKQFFKEK